MSKRKAIEAHNSETLKFEDKEYYAGMEKLVPWDRWVNFVSARLAKEGQEMPDVELHNMVRIYLLKELNALSDEQTGKLEAALDRSPVLRKFARLGEGDVFPADRFRRFLEFMERTGTGRVLCCDLIEITDQSV